MNTKRKPTSLGPICDAESKLLPPLSLRSHPLLVHPYPGRLELRDAPVSFQHTKIMARVIGIPRKVQKQTKSSAGPRGLAGSAGSAGPRAPGGVVIMIIIIIILIIVAVVVVVVAVVVVVFRSIFTSYYFVQPFFFPSAD